MTRDEKSLLLFLETCAVDASGAVDARHMNDGDMEIARRWATEGFIEFGRISARSIKPGGNRINTHWVVLSAAAWQMAHVERMERAQRLLKTRTYSRAKEERP